MKNLTINIFLVLGTLIACTAFAEEITNYDPELVEHRKFRLAIKAQLEKTEYRTAAKAIRHILKATLKG